MNDQELEEMKAREQVLYKEYTELKAKHETALITWSEAYNAINTETKRREMRASIIAEMEAGK